MTTLNTYQCESISHSMIFLAKLWKYNLTMSLNTCKEIYNKNWKCIMLTQMGYKHCTREVEIKLKSKDKNFKMELKINNIAESMES